MARIAAIGRAGGRRTVGWLGGLSAVASKELRGRMRGRRAFVTVTFYVGVLALFMVAVYQITKSNAESQMAFGGSSPYVSAQVGQAVFAGILVLETLIVLFLAPAFTTGAISLEREKQTLDLLAVTPLSALAIALGKLLSALTWVLILVFSSVPLTAIVFVFGGVAPEDIARGYAYVLALAIGLGALGLFFSAVARRTQAATVLSYITVLVIALGSGVGWLFWSALTGGSTSPQQPSVIMRGVDDANGGVVVVGAADVPAVGIDPSVAIDVPASTPTPGRPPEALLWLNPFVAVADLVCGTDTNAYSLPCSLVGAVTGRQPTSQQIIQPVPMPGWKGGVAFPDTTFQTTTARDTFWPQSAVAWLVLGIAGVLLSVRLVRPGGHLLPRFGRIPRPGRRLRLRRRQAAPEAGS